jgi:hypothetical protein
MKQADYIPDSANPSVSFSEHASEPEEVRDSVELHLKNIILAIHPGLAE